MRIAVLADPLDNQNAGIHVYTKEMVDAIIRNNTRHEIILLREKKDPALRGVEQIAIPNIRLPIGFASLRLFFIVPWILRRKKVDVVIEPAHFGPFNLPKKIKRITIIHDLTPILFPEFHRWHSQILQKIFLRRILNQSDLIISNSDNTTKDICKIYPENCKKVIRIYPGIGRLFKPTDENGELARYNIRKPYFLFVGTIEPRKNLLLLLKAFEIYKSNRSPILERGKGGDHSLVIAGGKGWKTDSFFKALDVHPYRNLITWTGFVPDTDLPVLYSNATALIYPSLYEGFGFPVIEALSCGSQVIAADNSCLRETGGQESLYFREGHAEELATLMDNISQKNLEKGTLTASMNDHLSKFNWDEFAREAWKSIEALK